MKKTEEEQKAFRVELAALYNKHGMWMASCGCCDGTFVNEGYFAEEGQAFTETDVEGR